jgi:type IV pilus assembly protein PilB
MGVESYLLAAALNSVLAQRLVRRICENCKIEEAPSDRLRQLFDEREIKADSVARGEGCKSCSQMGYSGRLGIHELFTIDDELRDVITQAASLTELRRIAKEKGHRQLAFDGLLKVASCETSFEEIMRVAEIK